MSAVRCGAVRCVNSLQDDVGEVSRWELVVRDTRFNKTL